MTATFDACVIGHVACDINTIGGVEYAPSPGGAAYYSTMVYRGLGLRVAIVTKVAEHDRHLLHELEDAGVEVFNLPSEATTTFRNDYPSAADPDLRIQRVDGRAGTIPVAALRDLRARIWQIGPLTADDVELDMIHHCAGLGGLVGLDVQGLTREVVGGRVQKSEPAKRSDYLRDLDVLKADDEEMLTYTGVPAVTEAVDRVRASGAREVLVTRASAGATIYGPDGAIAIDAVPPRWMRDATGCGDTFLAAYLARRLTCDDLRDCGEFAAAAASINIETLGAFRGTAEDIAARRATLRPQS
jgi:sugar/nucleoside kinase (ribokinase family)